LTATVDLLLLVRALAKSMFTPRGSPGRVARR
jgi:hypothetical protein